MNSRGRTPAPIAPRPKLNYTPTASSSSGINYGNSTSASSSSSSYRDRDRDTYSSTGSYYDSLYRNTSSRPSSRQSSVERSLQYPSSSDYSSSTYGRDSSSRYPELSNLSVRSRNSSPIRTFDSSNDRWSSSTRNTAALPPHPSLSSSTYDGYATLRRREPSAERMVQLRNRRENSQERMRSSVASSYLKHRRSSFVDNQPSKYY